MVSFEHLIVMTNTRCRWKSHAVLSVIFCRCIIWDYVVNHEWCDLSALAMFTGIFVDSNKVFFEEVRRFVPTLNKSNCSFI